MPRTRLQKFSCIIDEFDKNLNAELPKNKAGLVRSRHRSIHNFMMSLCSALAAYCFFDNNLESLPVHVEKPRQLEFFTY